MKNQRLMLSRKVREDARLCKCKSGSPNCVFDSYLFWSDLWVNQLNLQYIQTHSIEAQHPHILNF